MLLRQQMDITDQRGLRRARRQPLGLRSAWRRQDPCPVRHWPWFGGIGPPCHPRPGLLAGPGPLGSQGGLGPAASATQAGHLRLPAPGCSRLPAQGTEEPEVLSILVAEPYDTPVIGHHLQLGLLRVRALLRLARASSAPIDRIVTPRHPGIRRAWLPHRRGPPSETRTQHRSRPSGITFLLQFALPVRV